MKVEIKIDDSYIEPKILILTAAMTEDVNLILNKLSENTPQVISGCKNEKIEVIEQEDLIRIYAGSGKVFAVTEKGEYTVRFRLYEIEKRLISRELPRHWTYPEIQPKLLEEAVRRGFLSGEEE